MGPLDNAGHINQHRIARVRAIRQRSRRCYCFVGGISKAGLLFSTGMMLECSNAVMLTSVCAKRRVYRLLSQLSKAATAAAVVVCVSSLGLEEIGSELRPRRGRVIKPFDYSVRYIYGGGVFFRGHFFKGYYFVGVSCDSAHAVRCVCAARVLVGWLRARCVCVSSARFDWLAARALCVCAARARFGWLGARVFFIGVLWPTGIRSEKHVNPSFFFATAAKNCSIFEIQEVCPPHIQNVAGLGIGLGCTSGRAKTVSCIPDFIMLCCAFGPLFGLKLSAIKCRYIRFLCSEQRQF